MSIKTPLPGTVTHVLVEEVCFHCPGGSGRVSGGQVEYGEVVNCPICCGVGRLRKSVTLEELARLLKLVGAR